MGVAALGRLPTQASGGPEPALTLCAVRRADQIAQAFDRLPRAHSTRTPARSHAWQRAAAFLDGSVFGGPVRATVSWPAVSLTTKTTAPSAASACCVLYLTERLSGRSVMEPAGALCGFNARMPVGPMVPVS